MKRRVRVVKVGRQNAWPLPHYDTTTGERVLSVEFNDQTSQMTLIIEGPIPEKS